MHSSSLTAIVACVIAQGAYSQCVDDAIAPSTPVAAETTSPSAVSTTTPAGVQPRSGLIKAAAAGTRDGAPAARNATAAPAGGESDPPRRGGTAMLLAALALMSGIALRRYGASGP